jgi:hypothetical protein
MFLASAYLLIMSYLERLPNSMKEIETPDGEKRNVCIYTPHSLRATAATLLLDANMEEIGLRCECLELQGLAGEAGPYLKWLIEQAKGEIEIFSPEAREEIEQLCRTPLQVQRISWEAIKQGYQEGEKQISRDTVLNVIMPDFRDLRTELRRKGYTARDLAYDYGYNTAQVNRFLDGKLPVDDPAGKILSVFLKTLGIGQ